MSTKTVTMRMSKANYDKLSALAEMDNRSLSNFIETAAVRYVEHQFFVDDPEMAEIKKDKALMASLKRGSLDAKKKRGRFV